MYNMYDMLMLNVHIPVEGPAHEEKTRFFHPSTYYAVEVAKNKEKINFFDIQKEKKNMNFKRNLSHFSINIIFFFLESKKL